MNGRFLINRGDAKVMGVAAGLADCTGIDPTMVRLGFPLCRDGAARAASIGASRLPAGNPRAMMPA